MKIRVLLTGLFLSLALRAQIPEPVLPGVNRTNRAMQATPRLKPNLWSRSGCGALSRFHAVENHGEPRIDTNSHE